MGNIYIGACKPELCHETLSVSYAELYKDVPDSDRQTYLGMVTAMDDAVGDIVAALKETDMWVK